MNPQEFTLANMSMTPPTSWSYWAVEGLLLAGAYPGSPNANECREKIQALLNAGIATIVNLMEESNTEHRGNLFAPYDGHAKELGARCMRIPIVDLSIPTTQTMIAILDEIDQSLDEGLPVYVHCWGGIGRTGTVVGCWLLRHGLATKDTVLETIRQLRLQVQRRGRRESPETTEQQQFVLCWTE